MQTGLRLSEMTGLLHEDVSLGAGAHVRCRGKGRKERCTPLAKPAGRSELSPLALQNKKEICFFVTTLSGSAVSTQPFTSGPYVQQGEVVSKAYTTVSLLRTIKDVLGIDSMNFNDGLAEPMAGVFDLNQVSWQYQAIVPEVLRTTQLPLPPRTATNSLPLT